MKLTNKSKSTTVQTRSKVKPFEYGQNKTVRALEAHYQGKYTWLLLGYDLTKILGYKNPSSLVNKMPTDYQFILPKGKETRILLSPRGIKELFGHAKRRPNIDELIQWYHDMFQASPQPFKKPKAVKPTNDKVLTPQMFDFMGAKVRFVQVDSKTYAVGNDVSKAIGYQNYRKATNNNIKDKYKLSAKIRYAGQSRNVTLVSEHGIYQLVMQSELPKAAPFQDWLVEQVLPQIMHTGSYQSKPSIPTPSYQIDDSIERAKAWIKEEQARKTQAKMIQAQGDQIKGMQASYDAGEYLRTSQGSYSMKEAANIIGGYCGEPTLGRTKFMALLRLNGHLSKIRRTWNKPLQKVVNAGYLTYHTSYQTDKNGHRHITFTTEVTAQGLYYYMPRFKKWSQTMQWVDDIPERQPTYHAVDLFLDHPDSYPKNK